MSASASLLRPLQRASSPAGGITEGYVKLMIPGRSGAGGGGGGGRATTTLYSDAKSVVAKTKGNGRAVAASATSDGSGEVDIGAGGRIELIFGPMFAGKTTELLRRCQVAESAGRNVMLIKSSSDTRYSAAEAVTHDGAKRVRTGMQTSHMHANTRSHVLYSSAIAVRGKKTHVCVSVPSSVCVLCVSTSLCVCAWC